MIPKIIHYCWFGKAKKSELVKKCIRSWRKFLPDYEIKEWNEENCDIQNSCDFVKEAYGQKKWAYVSDYFRLKALNEHGGIYFDTDVEVLKSFDELLKNDFFCCFESEGYLCTAVLASAKENSVIKEFLDSYNERKFEEIPNSKLLFDFLIGEKEYSISENKEIADNCVIFPSNYFSPKDFYTKKIAITENTFAIHHFDGTWKGKGKKFKDGVQNLLVKILGKDKYFKFKNKYNGKN